MERGGKEGKGEVGWREEQRRERKKIEGRGRDDGRMEWSEGDKTLRNKDVFITKRLSKN